jgi:hypothetical protein
MDHSAFFPESRAEAWTNPKFQGEDAEGSLFIYYTKISESGLLGYLMVQVFAPEKKPFVNFSGEEVVNALINVG